MRPEEIAGLIALYYACNGSVHAHVPIERIRRKFSAPYRDEAKRIVEKLSRHPEGFVHIHKGRTISYGITMAGVKKLRDLQLTP